MDFDLIGALIPEMLFHGLPVTLSLAGLSLIIGVLIGVLVCVIQIKANKVFRCVASSYVFVFRGTPLLLLLIFFYYGLPSLPIIRDTPVLWAFFQEPYLCALLAFALNCGAYSAEIFRGALLGMPTKEIDAARALGFSATQRFRRIILPRTVQLALPAYSNEVVLMVKSTALASSITLVDVMGIARKSYADLYAPLEAFVAAAVVYLVLMLVLMAALRRIEHHFSRRAPEGARPYPVGAPIRIEASPRLSGE